MSAVAPAFERAGDHTPRSLVSERKFDEAWRLAAAELLLSDDASTWSQARNVLRAGTADGWTPPTVRTIRLAVLSSYEATELTEELRLACLALRVQPEIYTGLYGQLEQEILLDTGSLAGFEPTHVLIAPTTRDLGLTELTDGGDATLAEAEARWLTLWRLCREKLGARVIQHGFVVPDESALGNLCLPMPGNRVSLVRELNRRLAQATGTEVLLLDTERLAARIGKQRWEDPRLWYAIRRPYSAPALALLARETAAALAADLGLATRCLVLDLDNTLWGGVIGDDGPEGIVIGEGPEGEAYAEFQEYLAALHRRGLILAAASKNDLDAAREPFETNPSMRLSLDDFAMFVADWRPKSHQVTEIARTLGIGTDMIMFADDNPAECAEVAAALPDVATVLLDMPPAERVRALAANVRLALTSLSADDINRQQSYAARAQAASLSNASNSLEEFWSSLEMRAKVLPVNETSLDRAAQLTQKTNQFNLTLRRRTREQIARTLREEGSICMTLELEDRLARHGTIGLGVLLPSAEDRDVAIIDTLLLSCRAIGRTAEVHLLSHLSRRALQLGFTRLRGVYVPGPRNSLVADLYPQLGFAPVDDEPHRWDYDLVANGALESLYIEDRR